ncbi:MAG: M20/M25/M40 family metallo-hydrolase, partial [Clostridia bacterium]|nr:M20/M25/M40 family metallo-hydrolase [Clostridia bacterium]
HIVIRKGSVGCVAKNVVYKGVSAHAGGSPWNGCNALYAASNGLSAINAIRETFKEDDLIRVHPIIKQGGGAVNAIPDNVVIESYVRGASFDAIYNANKKVNRALCGAALSIGANVEINDTPGYSPLLNSSDMADVAYEAAQYIEGVNVVRNDSTGTGSTDMGDLSAIMPAVHPYMPGATGTSHGSNYFISDPELACVGSAKWQMVMIHLLLKDGAKRAKSIVENFEPTFKSKEEYFEYIKRFESSGKRITYNDDQTATVKL